VYLCVSIKLQPPYWRPPAHPPGWAGITLVIKNQRRKCNRNKRQDQDNDQHKQVLCELRKRPTKTSFYCTTYYWRSLLQGLLVSWKVRILLNDTCGRKKPQGQGWVRSSPALLAQPAMVANYGKTSKDNANTLWKIDVIVSAVRGKLS
jgi:hypothetical protein